jgi:hypothetical protein
MTRDLLEILNRLHDSRLTFVIVGGVEDLITMKQRAGRPHDPLDIAELESIRQRQRP